MHPEFLVPPQRYCFSLVMQPLAGGDPAQQAAAAWREQQAAAASGPD